MKDNLKFEKIKEILKDEYEDRLSDEILKSFAEDLYSVISEDIFSLDYIFNTIFDYEFDENIGHSDSDYLFGRLLALLENNEGNARRLYQCFIYIYEGLDVFLKLYENAEYLSAKELAIAKAKALSMFDRQTLEIYGITEEE